MAILNRINLCAGFDLGEHRGQVRLEAWRRIRAPIMLAGTAFILLMTVVSIAWGQLVGLVVALVFIMLVGIAEVIAQWRDTTETVVAEAMGREQVRRRLTTLESRGWCCVHRFEISGEMIDHIAWGPKGVFVIASKSDRGKVGIESGVLTLGGMMPQRHYIQELHQQVTSVRDLLRKKLGHRVWVEGVICMTRAFVDGYRIDVSKPPTHVVHLGKILECLETFNARRELSPEDLDAVAQALKNPPDTA